MAELAERGIFNVIYTTNFDRLIESDFFGRLRQFKESINELFYEPSVTVSAIGSNVRIGNAYVNLIFKERQKLDAESIQAKYGEFNEQSGSVSDAAGRTLELGGLLDVLTDEVIKAETAAQNEPEPSIKPQTPEAEPRAEKARSPWANKLVANVKGINKVLVGVCLLLLLVTGGLYVWSTHIVDENVSTAGVAKVDLDNSPLSAHIRIGKISRETFYGVLQPSWNALSKEKREEFLQTVMNEGAERGYRQVSLIAKDGKTAGYASATRIEVNMP